MSPRKTKPQAKKRRAPAAPRGFVLEAVTRSPAETVKLGRRLARLLKPPVLVLLEGELGSGKTTLTKGLVAGRGAAREEDVTSPTFTLVHEYGPPPEGSKRSRKVKGSGPQGGKARPVYHVDLYRIETSQELFTLGLEDLLARPVMVIVEWGEKLEGVFPGRRVRVRLEHLKGDRRRIIVERPEA